MADTNTNLLQPMRFEAGGVFRITDGATDYALRNRQKGSVNLKWATYEPLPWQENGINQVPLEGDNQVPEVEVTIKLSKDDATDIMTLMAKRNTSSLQGLVYAYTVVIQIPYYRGATTGRKFTLTSAYFMPGETAYQAGTDFDTLKFKMGAVSVAASVY